MNLRLTPREIDVVVAYCVLGSYAEVSRVLGIKVQTVKNHMQAARDKYRVVSNTALLDELGWLTVPRQLLDEIGYVGRITGLDIDNAH